MAPEQPMTTVTAAAVAVWLIQRLKASPHFRWLQEGKALANRVAAIAVATASALGVQMHYDGATHVLTIANLSLTGIAAAAWIWVKQFAAQEIIYQVAANKPSHTEFHFAPGIAPANVWNGPPPAELGQATKPKI